MVYAHTVMGGAATVMLGLAVARPPPPPGFVNGGSPPGVPFATDCALRILAWEYGKTIAPKKVRSFVIFVRRVTE